MKNIRLWRCVAVALCVLFALSVAAAFAEEVDLAELLDCAEKGDADAQCRLGIMLLTGQNFKKDEEQAVYWFKKSAGQGNVEAQILLAFSYFEGVERDEARAFKLAKTIAEKDPGSINIKNIHGVEEIYSSVEELVAAAQIILGVTYYEGRGGVQKDLEQAEYWFDKAVGHASEPFKKEAERILKKVRAEIRAEKARKEVNSPDNIIKRAESGDTDAQFTLGMMYYNGENVKQDYEQAFYWLKKATDKRPTTRSRGLLAYMYLKGIGCRKDDEQAFKMFKEISEQNESDVVQEMTFLDGYALDALRGAQLNLGLMYADGIGTNQDLEKAEFWLNKVAEHSGEDIKKEAKKALENIRAKKAQTPTAPAQSQSQPAQRRAMTDAEFIKLCEFGTAQEVAEAIRNGANVNAKNKYGWTALMYASRDNPNPEVITALVKAGADVNVKDNNGLTALDLAEGNNALKGTDAIRLLGGSPAQSQQPQPAQRGALTDAEYKQMLKDYPDFAKADKALNAAWARAKKSMKAKDFEALKQEQVKWISGGRDAQARELMNGFTTREDAYATVTLARAYYVAHRAKGEMLMLAIPTGNKINVRSKPVNGKVLYQVSNDYGDDGEGGDFLIVDGNPVKGGGENWHKVLYRVSVNEGAAEKANGFIVGRFIRLEPLPILDWRYAN